MFGRLLRIAPTLAISFGLGGCAVFASDPQQLASIGADEHVPSLKDEWTPTVVKTAAATSLAPAAQPKVRSPAGATQRVASCKTDSECIIVLSALINDPKRSWIGQPQSPADYANGTRFFAYRALRPRLSCRELKTALSDIQSAAVQLKSPGQEVASGQTDGALALGRAVRAELRAERATRCKR